MQERNYRSISDRRYKWPTRCCATQAVVWQFIIHADYCRVNKREMVPDVPVACRARARELLSMTRIFSRHRGRTPCASARKRRHCRKWFIDISVVICARTYCSKRAVVTSALVVTVSGTDSKCCVHSSRVVSLLTFRSTREVRIMTTQVSGRLLIGLLRKYRVSWW